jgi:hypothetical protein
MVEAESDKYPLIILCGSEHAAGATRRSAASLQDILLLEFIPLQENPMSEKYTA